MRNQLSSEKNNYIAHNIDNKWGYGALELTSADLYIEVYA